MHQAVTYRDLFNSHPQDTLARLKLLYSNATGGLFVTIVCMAVFCFAFDTPASQESKNILFGVYVVIHSLRIVDNVYTRRSFRSGEAQPFPIAWRFSIGIIANSLVWATYSFMFVAQMQPNQVTLCAVILSALAGGTITILAASTLLSVFYMSCLLIPFVIMGFFNSFEYFYYISFLGIIFWFVMLASARQIGKFLTEVLKLKNENAKVLKLMDAEQKEVERVNEALTGANSMLDSYASRLETEVESRTQELFRLSNIDSLTNLKNRTAFLKRIKEVLRDASSTDSANGNEGQYL